MMTLHRGSIVRAYFPFDSDPRRRGPFAHYCLFSDRLDGADGRSVYVVAYGTSRLDEDMIKQHGHGNGILSIDSKFVRGEMSGPVTHFLARHVAVIPSTWVQENFSTRLDFMRPHSRENDLQRQRLFKEFEAFEAVLDEASYEALDYFEKTGRVGLQPGKTLRPRYRR